MASANNDSNVIASSRRPDGSWRKERRVKPGYVPQDEVDKYESRTKKFMTERSTYPPGYTPPVETQIASCKNQKKNARKKQKKREEGVVQVAKELSNLSTNAGGLNAEPDLADRVKKEKNLKKKLKQIEQLEERKASGEKLESEQLEKILKRAQFEEELEAIQL